MSSLPWMKKGPKFTTVAIFQGFSSWAYTQLLGLNKKKQTSVKLHYGKCALRMSSSFILGFKLFCKLYIEGWLTLWRKEVSVMCKPPGY